MAAVAAVSAAIFTAIIAKRTHEPATKTTDMAEATKVMAAETRRVPL